MKTLAMMLTLAVNLLIASCSQTDDSVLRVGTNIWPGYEPLYLAQEKGWMAPHNIQLVEYSTASQTIQAYRNKLIDGAALTLDEALLLLESGEDITLIQVLDVSAGADAIVAQKNIHSVKELNGKSLGVENYALGAYVLTRAQELAALPDNAFKVVPLTIDEQEKAFKQKKVDAVVTFEPVLSKLLQAGGRVVFDSTDIPGEIIDVLVVRSRYLAKYPQQIHQLQMAWYHALSAIEQDPDNSLAILAKRMHLTQQQTKDAYKGLRLVDQAENEKLVSGDEPQLLKSAQKLVKVMQNKGLLLNPVEPKKMISKH